MRTITYAQAIQEAMREEMRRDERVILIGEDIGVYGGAFGVTAGMIEEFGPRRVKDTPISEAAIAGAAVGAAATGLRPIMEIMFMDFVTLTMDQIVNQAAKMRYMYGGKASVPLVVRMPAGSGTGAAAQHSQSLEAWLCHVPGLKVVAPGTPRDAKGLLKAAIRDDNPVMFVEQKLLYRTEGEVPEEMEPIPIGVAEVKRSGTDVTVIAYGRMLPRALAAAEQAQAQGIGVEVVDPRTLVPLDHDTLIASVKKTGRAIIVHEACKTAGYGAEIAAMIAESEAFDYLDAPIQRIAGADTPIPYNPQLEQEIVPSEQDILDAILRAMHRSEAR